MNTEKLMEKVYQALDHAVENGYDMSLTSWKDSMAIAEDLVEFDAELEEYDPEQLLPHVEHWMLKAGK